jgi:hypothetical protein
MLTQQYKLLLSTLGECQQNLAINYMAIHKPLNNLIESRETIREYPEIPITPKELLDIDLSEVYKKYED